MEIDNRTIKLGEELKKELKTGSKVKMAAATFSMFAYQSLKEELEQIEELKFIFTSPTFTTDEFAKEYREYAIPKKKRESSIFGAEYELKLMNELTQKALARECADWVRRKVQFKSINVDEEIDNGIQINNGQIVSVDKLKNFDRKELGYENSLFKSSRNLYHQPQSLTYLQNFESYWEDDEHFRDVTEEVLENLTLAHKEHSPEFLYYVMLYHIFSEFLEDINQDQLPNEHVQYKQTKIWNMLYDFQKDAVKSLIAKLERYNGCILADSVGLGKTFTALAVMTYYAYRGKRILVLCPKKLEHNWNMYRHDYVNNPIYDRYLQYDVLYHTDLSRDKGESNGIDLALNRWDTYDLVVIDESHNFRNGGSSDADLEDGRENRYSRLMNKIIKSGVPTKVLMLSATPVNNRFNDLKNQLALAYEGNAAQLDAKLETKSSVNDIFRMAQLAYNQWAELPVQERTTAALLEKLDFDFFKVLDSVTIARSRKHIRQFYDRKTIGDFPERLKPLNYYPDLTVNRSDITYKRIYQLLDQLSLTIYQPSLHIHPSKRALYDKEEGKSLTQLGRETGIKQLMMINLLKRLESSVEAFRYTLVEVVKDYVDKTLQQINAYQTAGGSGTLETQVLSDDDFDIEDSNSEFFVGKKIAIKLEDMDYVSWKRELEKDQAVLTQLEDLIRQVSVQEDQKLQTLLQLIDDKVQNPINPGNQKLIIFSAFATTTDYLYKHISKYALEKYGLHTAQISGSKGYKSSLPLENKELNTLLTYFSPKSKNKKVIFPDDDREIDILIATDVISEGQNLQDADTMVNYDIHWNPVRIVQRFGRVDRIGSQNKVIQLVNFWPNIELDSYIDLKARVESRMKISVLTSTADDNVLTNEEIEENNYRKKQLERLQSEVVDLEEMNEGISIMDLGLEDFRMDLIAYLEQHPKLADMPQGIQAVVEAGVEEPTGAIFLLKNVANKTNLSKKNRLHPYYLVYVDSQGKTVYSVADTKALLEHIRYITKGKDRPETDLVTQYNQATNDGVNMAHYSSLLQSSLDSLVESDETSFIDSLFATGVTDFLNTGLEGSDDFELLAFFTVLKKED
ncbi:helicase-related protein [Streptococcus oriscaviae]|uniref:DEAD/DEAH box helicase family protein n=1 Tax=Streptococcus oriscaviae TaxID=2781599 RepID=A0ABX7YNL6_9STRE|nr:helicase-related protein [Streptococcus oriscaviae]QUE54844.1 DEAD/DEAH box helicase family protein [Streptococcus oriscaviae]